MSALRINGNTLEPHERFLMHLVLLFTQSTDPNEFVYLKHLSFLVLLIISVVLVFLNLPHFLRDLIKDLGLFSLDTFTTSYMYICKLVSLNCVLSGKHEISHQVKIEISVQFIPKKFPRFTVTEIAIRPGEKVFIKSQLILNNHLLVEHEAVFH